MEKKSLLLPHCWQVIGWWLLVAFVLLVSIIATIAYCRSDGAMEVAEETKQLYALGLYFIPYVSLMLICLSREKVEDEYISHIRGRATFIVVIFGFVASLLISAFANYAVHMLNPDIVGQFLMYAQWFRNTAVLAIVYLLIFKGTLFVNKLKARGDGE